MRHRSRQHRTNAQLRKFASLVRSQRPDAANLHSDGTEICEATQSKSGDCERTWIQCAFHRPKKRKRDQLVESHAKSQEVSDGATIVPRNANDPRNGRKEPAKNYLKRLRKPRSMIVYAAHNSVGESD